MTNSLKRSISECLADGAKSLVVHDESLTDLSPISKLVELEELTLDAGCLTDYSHLAFLTSLRKLSLRSDEHFDLTPIASLSRLEELYICDGRIHDLRPIASISSLQHLSLSFLNEIDDLAPLGSLLYLRSIYLENCAGISDASPLSACTGIESIEFIDCFELHDLAFLPNLKSLNSVTLEGMSIRKLDDLRASCLVDFKCKETEEFHSTASSDTSNWSLKTIAERVESLLVTEIVKTVEGVAADQRFYCLLLYQHQPNDDDEAWPPTIVLGHESDRETIIKQENPSLSELWNAATLRNRDLSIELELNSPELIEACRIHDELMLEHHDWTSIPRILRNVVANLNAMDWSKTIQCSEALIVGAINNVGDLEPLDPKKEFERYAPKMLKMLKKKGLF